MQSHDWAGAHLEQDALGHVELLAQVLAKAPQLLGHQPRLVELRHARVRLGKHLRPGARTVTPNASPGVRAIRWSVLAALVQTSPNA